MKNVLFATCAALVIATGAFSASAGQFTATNSGSSGLLIRVDDDHYYNDGYYDNGGNSWQYQYQDHGNGWSNGAYHRHDMVPPGWIVRNLQRSDYRYISRPVLSGRFYQVKAVNPNGHKVKLFIDAYTGQIVKVKG